MDKIQAQRLWESLYGEKTVAYDFAAQEIHKEDYRNPDSFYCWREDYIRPLTSGGRNVPSNLRIESQSSYDRRDGKSNFRIGNAIFEVRKGRKYGTYALFDVTDRNHPFNREPDLDNQNEFYNRNRFNLIYGKKQEKFNLKNPSAIGQAYFKENTKGLVSSQPIIEMPLDEEEDSPSILSEVKEENPVPEQAQQKRETAPETILENQPVREEEKVPEEEAPSMEKAKEKLLEEAQEAPSMEEKELVLEDEKPSPMEASSSGKQPISFAEEDKRDELNEEIRSLQNELDALQDKIIHLENENNELSSKNEELTASYKEKNDALSAKVSSLSEEALSKDKEKEEILLQLEAIKREKEELEKQKVSSQEEKNTLLKEKEDRQNKLSSYQEEKDQLNRELNQLKEEKESLSSSFATYKEESEKDKNKASASYQEQSSSLKNENEELKNQIQEREARISSLESALNQKEKEANDNEAKSDAAYSSLQSENEKLKQEVLLLNDSLTARKKERDAKAKSYDDLEKNYSQLDAQSVLVDDQKAQLEEEIKNLNDSLQDTNNELSDIKNENENNKQVILDYQSQIKDRTEENKQAASSLNARKEERDHRRKTSREYNTKYTNLLSDNAKEKEQWEKEKKDYIQEISTLTEAKDSLSSQLDDKKKKYLFYFSGGDEEYYDSFLFYRGDHSYPFDEEHVRKAINENPFWKRKEDTNVYPFRGKRKEVMEEDVSFVETKRKAAILSIPVFEYFYGKEKKEACDFAGRIIKKDDFRREESPYGWDYKRYDPLLDEDKKSSYFIASLQTRKDISLKESFKTNGFTYQLEKTDQGYRFSSLDDVYDIYDLPKAREITRFNQKKTTPVLYLFVRVVPNSGDEIKKEDLSDFFDLLDKTVHRACPLSFRERKSSMRSPKDSYAFLIFDGRKEGAYQEVLSFATLINSYRNAFKKEGKLNAILVLDQVMLPFSYRHLTFENRLTETNDSDRRAVYYHLLQVSRIDSTIKRTIHIGPEILPRLNIPKERLGESKFINANFALIYNFKENYVLYNYGYEIKKQ